MRGRRNLRASVAWQAGRKDRQGKRPGAFEATRPSVSDTSHTPFSKEQRPCIA